jgi:hypothetical protein
VQLNVCPESVQVHPVPAADTGVKSVTSVSETVTAPDVGAFPTFETPIVNSAPACPSVKFPECVFVIDTSGTAVIVVGLFAVSFDVRTSPPPETVAVLVTLAAAFSATFAVRVMAG